MRPGRGSGTGLALVLFAKAPRPGRVKTRLLPYVTAEAAADLQAALLRDTVQVTLAAARTLAQPPWLYCAAAEAADESPLRQLLPPEFQIVAQGPGDLGERLIRVFAELLKRHAAALALGTDCADLTPEILREALEALARRRTVLGAAQDGGYWTIGLDQAHPELFRDVVWSSASVADSTRRRMAELDLDVEDLQVLRDIDRFEDIVEWARRPNPIFSHTIGWCRARGFTVT